MVLVTAELPPPGAQSSQARTLLVEWKPDSVIIPELTSAQNRASAYPMAMAGYVYWLAPQMNTLKVSLPALLRKLAARFEKEGITHGRIAESAAKLYLGANSFLACTHAYGVTDDEAQKSLQSQAYQAILYCAKRTNDLQRGREPGSLFIELLRTILLQKRGYLAERKTGDIPGEPNDWGYEKRGDNEGETRWQPPARADKLGWVDNETQSIYLIPEAVRQAVISYAAKSGDRFPANSTRALGDILERERILARKPSAALCCLGARGRGETRNEVSIRCEGKPCWCWAMAIETLYPNEPARNENQLVKEVAGLFNGKLIE